MIRRLLDCAAGRASTSIKVPGWTAAGLTAAPDQPQGRERSKCVQKRFRLVAATNGMAGAARDRLLRLGWPREGKKGTGSLFVVSFNHSMNQAAPTLTSSHALFACCILHCALLVCGCLRIGLAIVVLRGPGGQSFSSDGCFGWLVAHPG